MEQRCSWASFSTVEVQEDPLTQLTLRHLFGKKKNNDFERNGLNWFIEKKIEPISQERVKVLAKAKGIDVPQLENYHDIFSGYGYYFSRNTPEPFVDAYFLDVDVVGLPPFTSDSRHEHSLLLMLITEDLDYRGLYECRACHESSSGYVRISPFISDCSLD